MGGTPAAEVEGAAWGRGSSMELGPGKRVPGFLPILETCTKSGSHKGGSCMDLLLQGNGKSEGEKVTHGTHFFH